MVSTIKYLRSKLNIVHLISSNCLFFQLMLRIFLGCQCCLKRNFHNKPNHYNQFNPVVHNKTVSKILITTFFFDVCPDLK